MKKIFYILPAFLLLPFLGSCDKELMDYEGQDGLFFDAQYGAEWGDTTVWAHQLYTLVSFGNVDDEELEAAVKVAVAGSVKDYPRPFKLKLVADSTTVSEEEYEFLTQEFVIPANQNHTYLRMKFKKSDRMKETTLQLQVALEPNDHFTLPFSEIGQIPGRWDDVRKEYSTNDNPSIHNFFVNNMLVKPNGWHDVQFGYTYTQKKHELLLKIAYEKFGFGKADFEEKSKMQAGRAQAIAKETVKFLKAQYALGREHWILDEDGTMMWVSGCPWAVGTNPDDMV
jgi:hypothetical protein